MVYTSVCVYQAYYYIPQLFVFIYTFKLSNSKTVCYNTLWKCTYNLAIDFSTQFLFPKITHIDNYKKTITINRHVLSQRKIFKILYFYLFEE